MLLWRPTPQAQVDLALVATAVGASLVQGSGHPGYPASPFSYLRRRESIGLANYLPVFHAYHAVSN